MRGGGGGWCSLSCARKVRLGGSSKSGDAVSGRAFGGRNVRVRGNILPPTALRSRYCLLVPALGIVSSMGKKKLSL